jgi:N utilization substance protein A
MSREIVEAVRELERDRNLESGILVDALRDGLLAAYKKTPGSYRHATVEIDDAGDFRVYAIHMPTDLEERLLDEARERALDELERIEEETGEKQHTLITDDDLEIDWDQVPEDQVRREDVTPANFGRIAAQTAKQVIQQRIREAERQIMYEEYVDRVSEVVTGIVQQAGDRNNILVDLGKVEALLPRSEQVDGERYEQGSRIKAVITEVRSGTKGPQVILSRRDPELIKTLFELEVPEIADGLVEIRGVAREPGYRSKIAVVSHAQGVDPVGACVGPRGSRVRMVVSELRGEKIDIIPWNTEPARFLAKALSPARVREVYIDDETKEATVIVPEDQLALAIGKEGLNARLAARLTGWKVDIQSEAEFAAAEAEAAFAGEEGEDFSGRCAAILSNGKRCPNAAIPGTRFCGIPAHAALADREAAGETIEAGQAVPIGGAEEPEAEAADAVEAVDEVPSPEPSEVPAPEPSPMPAPEPSPEPSVPQPTTLPTPEPAEVPGPEPTSVPPTPAAEEAPLEERPSGIPIEASSEAEVEPAEQTPVQAPAGVGADATLQEEEPLHGTPVGRDEAPPA